MTEIILAVITLVSSSGWVVSRSQLRRSKAQAEKEELDLSAEYVKSFKNEIYEPLRSELQKLRQSIEKINNCPHRGNCPVAHELYNHPSESDNQC